MNVENIHVYDGYYIVPSYNYINPFGLFKDIYNIVIEDLKDGVVHSYIDRRLLEYEVIGNSSTINKKE